MQPYVVVGSSLGAGRDRPWLRIGELRMVEVEDGGVFDSGSGSSLGSRYPTGILGRTVVKEPLLVELVVCQSKGLGCLSNSLTQTRSVSYFSRCIEYAEAVQ